MLRETTVGDVVVLSAPGELTSGAAREIEARMVVLMRSHARRFIFDLSSCTELPTDVMHALARVKLELDRLGGALVVAGAVDEVLQSLKQSGLGDRLTALPSLNLALRFLEGGWLNGAQLAQAPAAFAQPRVQFAEPDSRPAAVLSAREGMHRIQALLGTLPAPPFLARQESGEDW